MDIVGGVEDYGTSFPNLLKISPFNDAHLADLMGFSLDHVLRGAAASGKWLISP
ncbi:hypothetical protein RGR602_PB00382 (plasmid) [Rhizobium gallicum bv. gallicum R602sp]|uniref:Uncharacterized protein n=1 Tax=Rhizobium gallicum bv. gallicum R602sp TaxID=1041138 RepID=A0A0B4XBD9_9HYPH|nr:hypothetical protein RGR602_PB00382 [Rhizobium gallicum bv. gallicum R602sp]